MNSLETFFGFGGAIPFRQRSSCRGSSLATQGGVQTILRRQPIHFVKGHGRIETRRQIQYGSSAIDQLHAIMNQLATGGVEAYIYKNKGVEYRI
jgi:hypothetical protein